MSATNRHVSSVAVNESVLRWAINRAMLTPDDLTKMFPKILQWINGNSQPTFRQLESLAKKTMTPLGYFFLTEPPKEQLSIPNFRTLGDERNIKPSPNLLETIQTMQRRQAWMREYLIEQGQAPLPFVRVAKQSDPTESIAEKILQTLNFNSAWANQESSWENALRTIREGMEDIGIIVVTSGIVGGNTHRKLNPDEFRGFVLIDEYAPFVFVNGADGKAAQMFTLAHELAHIFLGSSAIFDLHDMQPADNPMELKCNSVAAEFLIPEHEIRKIWPNIKNDHDCFKNLARRFKVSEIVAARRALDMNLIDKNAFLSFYRQYQNDAHRKTVGQKETGGNYYANLNYSIGRRFGSAVIRATLEGKLLYSEAYQLTGLNGNTFKKFADSLNIGGQN